MIHWFERDQWSWEEAKEKGECTHHKNLLLCMGDRGGEVSDEKQNESTGIDFYTFQLDYSSFLDSSSCFFPRRSYPTVSGRSSGEPPAPSARQPSMRLRLRGRPWIIWRSPNAGALTTQALFSQLKHELSKKIWNCTREWHQGLTPERDTREWHQGLTPESDTRDWHQEWH